VGLDPAAGSLLPLRRNRDFQLLWSGQLVSWLGSRMRAVATPLLVLALTGSPLAAALVSVTTTLPLVLLMLPAGVVLDRVDRRRAMLICEATRGVAAASIAVALWAGGLTYVHILLFAIVNGVAYPFFAVGERCALRQLVPSPQLPAAMAQKEARDFIGLIAGQLLGGLLFGIGRLLPYVADAATYAVSLTSLLLIRGRFQEDRPAGRRVLCQELAEGLTWLWCHPFVRTTALLSTGLSVVANALYLAVIVAAQRAGAPPAMVGEVVAFMGVGGLAGSLIATTLARALSVRAVALLALSSAASLTLALALATSPLLMGLLFGATFLFQPAWAAASGAWQVRLVPEHLLSRVQSAVMVLDAGAIPLSQLAVGLVLQPLGPGAAIVLLAGVAACGAAAALVSRSLRLEPPANQALPAVEPGPRPTPPHIIDIMKSSDDAV
jgi:MFS family permease